MGATEKMRDAVKAAKRTADAAEIRYEGRASIIEMEASRPIDLFGGDAGSRVLSIASKAKEACDDLYATYQSLVASLDSVCRPLLDEGPGISAVKEVVEMMRYLNEESRISSSFSASLNGSSLGGAGGSQYFPTLSNQMIQKDWENVYNSMPGAAEEDAAYRMRKQKEREEAVLAERKAREAEREARRLEAERKRKEKEAEGKRQKAVEKENVAVLARERRKAHLSEGWISMAEDHLAVRKADGTVAACGSNDKGQCNVSGWKDVVQVVCTRGMTFGLTAGGNVLAAGSGIYSESSASWWSGMRQIAAGDGFLVGLSADGSVRTTAGTHRESTVPGPQTWTGVLYVSVCGETVIGVMRDGSVRTVEYNHYGRSDRSSASGAENWKGPWDVAAGDGGACAILSDGRCVSTGSFGRNSAVEADALSKAGRIVKVRMSGLRPVGLTDDGRLVIGKRDGEDWAAGKLESLVSEFKSPVAAFDTSTYGLACLTKDGRVRVALSSSYGGLSGGQQFGNDFRAFDDYDKLTEEMFLASERAAARQREMQKRMAGYQAKGLCRHCGGEFKKGFLGTLRCSKCGRSKDY